MGSVSIKTKLLVPVGLLLTIILSMFGGTMYVTSHQADDSVVINLAGRQRMLTEKMTEQVLSVALAEKGERAEMEKALANTMKVFDMTHTALLESGKAPLGTNLEKTAYRELPKSMGEAATQLAKVDTVWTNYADAVKGYLASGDKSLLKKIHTLNDSLVQSMNVAVDLYQKQSEAWVSGLRFFQVVVLFIGLAFTVLVLYVVRSITGTLAQITGFAERLNSNDLTAKLDIHSKDELGQIAAVLNRMGKNLLDIINEVKSTSFSLTSASTQLATMTEQINATITEQSHQVSSVAAAMEEMNASATEVLHNIKETQVKSEDATESTAEGKNKLQQTVQRIEAIRARTQDLAGTIGNLTSSTEQIGSIINIIEDIADQTNLLALNAAIEAARAGDAGRGFAVVADEVRKLAERTQTATGEILKIIGTLTQEAKLAKDAMTEAERGVQEGVKIVGENNRVFDKIVSTVNDIYTSSGAIAYAAQEQSRTTNTVNENTMTIVSGISETTHALRDLTSAAGDLQVRSEQLSNVVKKFKTN